MTKAELHIVIVGAGLGGLAAAIGIRKAGHRVSVIEQTPVLGEVGAGIQIPPNSAKILDRWGLLDKIQACSMQPKNFVLRSYRDGKILSVQNMEPYAKEKYGAPYLHIYRADYHRILVEEAERLGVEIHLGCTVTGVDFETPSVSIKGKSEFLADVVIGADGLKSLCRSALVGHPDPPHLTGDLAYRVIVPAKEMLKYDELRDLVAAPMINYWMGPSGHAVCYLLGGGLYNIVLIRPDDIPPGQSIAEADLNEMMEFFKDWDPKLKTLLGLIQSSLKWKLQNSKEMETWCHPSGKFALLGDACHATLPYLAQGAAMAVEDGATLGALFSKLEDKSKLYDLLQLYELLRKKRTTRVVQGSTDLRDVFHMQDGEAQAERDRQMLEMEPFEGYPNRWADPVFQKFLFGYDADREADKAWKIYQEKGPSSFQDIDLYKYV
ncbi:hypothetical protein V1511DRAFT_482331 [Dipodascopsis uninucleata]